MKRAKASLEERLIAIFDCHPRSSTLPLTTLENEGIQHGSGYPEDLYRVTDQLLASRQLEQHVNEAGVFVKVGEERRPSFRKMPHEGAIAHPR